MLLAIFLALFFACAAQKSQGNPAVVSSNKLAFKLYPILQKKNPDMIYSPPGIAVAFGTASLAASGKAKTELARVMSWNVRKMSSVHNGMKQFLDTLRRTQDSVTKVYFANRIYADKSAEASDQYTEDALDYYGADLGSEKFAAESSKSRKRLNRWIKEETKSTVKNFLPYGVLSSTDRVVLVNAVHFKGNWDKGFKGKLTKNEEFRADGKRSGNNVPIMRLEDNFNYGVCDKVKAQVLEMFFNGLQFSMFVFLPKGVPLKTMESKLTYQSFQECISNVNETRVRVFLPSFKLRDQIQMTSIFQELGVSDLFDDKVGLAGISGAGGERVKVDKIFHQSFISVGEKGKSSSGHPRSKRTPIFKADHPFAFFVRENTLGSILLVGRVETPKQKLPSLKHKDRKG